jgi:hypothetical protein
MLTKISDTWNSLPHPLQAAIMLFGGAAIGVLKHKLAVPDACLTAVCLKGYVIDALHGGVGAVVALYIPANLPK